MPWARWLSLQTRLSPYLLRPTGSGTGWCGNALRITHEIALDSSLRTLEAASTTRLQARSFGGWALEEVLAVDDLTPGFLAASCRWGAARRQISFLILASLRDENLVDVVAARLDGALLESGVDVARTPRSVVGHALLTLRPRGVLCAVLGGFTPPGLAGTLARLGFDPLPAPDAYADIVRLFRSDDPVDRARVRVLGQLAGPITIGQIQALTVLDPVLIHRVVVRHVRSRDSAETLACAVAYLRRYCSFATDEALRASLDAWPVDRDIKLWVRRWVERIDNAPALDDLVRMIDGRPDIKLLASGAELAVIERRYRHLRNVCGEVLAGRHAYVEYRPSTSDADAFLGVLRWTSRGYMLDRIDRPGHRLGPDAGMAVLRNHLRAAGVIVRGRAPVKPKVRAALAAWLGVYPWGRDDDVVEDDILDDVEERV